MIYICSKKELDKYLGLDNPFLISFLDDESDKRKDISFSDTHFVKIPDIEFDELEEYGYTYETFISDADVLADKINNAINEKRDIICQCEYGESRSAGCAAAILEHYYGEGIEVFANYKYLPSKLVYNRVIDELRKRVNGSAN